MATIAFQVMAAASWRRVRTVTRTSAAAAICSEVGAAGGAGRPPAERSGAVPSVSASSPGILAVGRHGRRAAPRSSAGRASGAPARCRRAARRWPARGGARAPRSGRSCAGGRRGGGRRARARRRRAGRRSVPRRARTSRCPASGVIVWRSSLRAAARSVPSSRLVDAEQVGDLRPRPVGKRHERQRTSLERRERGQRGFHLANGRRRVHRTGGAGGHWSQRRALHEPGHNSPPAGHRASVR